MVTRADTKVQELVHKIEMGSLRAYVFRAIFLAAVAGLAGIYLFYDFRGLDSETAMDQAQIGRQIAAGAGFSTLYVRPLAVWQFQTGKGELPQTPLPDIYNFPLNPALNAALLRPIKRWWPMEPTDTVYVADRVIAGGGVAMFLASVFVLFFLVRGLFDSKIAWTTVVLVMVTDMMWRFSVSGLPQNAVLFLFTCALFLLHRALEARDTERVGRVLFNLSGVAVLLALATLAQPLVAWIFIGCLAFTALSFRPRSVTVLLVLFIYVLVVTPWLVRNYLVCGNPLGIGVFAILDGTSGTESFFMRSLDPDLTAFGAVRGKLRSGFTGQFENLFSYLGFNIAAAAFFFAMLHVFRRPATNALRWGVALMWLGAALGMALFSPQGIVSANQLHGVFVPIFAGFGMAFLLVLWNRLEIRFEPARNALIVAVCCATALPMAVKLLTVPPLYVAWPPYAAPIINSVCRWMKQGEVICSDMPWATAWYGGALSLQLPLRVEDFVTMHDYKTLGGPINGLYLTPVSGNRPFLTQLERGEYAGWKNYILRRAEIDRGYAIFPLKSSVALPIDGECIFYSDTERWTVREDL